MDQSFFDALPDELVEAIVIYLPPASAVAFGTTCKRNNKFTYEPLVWRGHCVQGWRFWESRHNFHARLAQPPAQTKWRQLYNNRRRTDEEALALFNSCLEAQQYRLQRIEAIGALGDDVKDLLLRERDGTSEDVEDVLARRYHANAILGQIHRKFALEKWTRVYKHEMISLEEALGAYDVFVLGGRVGDLVDISKELDRLAVAIRALHPEFDELSIRKKAMQISKFLRAEQLVGNQDENDFHALHNNFISLALFERPHSSLPLQSVAIYCAVARRLGVNAKPSNYPHHVHAVIEAPSDTTLDGRPRNTPQGEEAEPEQMHLDPWRSSDEVPRSDLTLRLTQMGAPPAQHAYHLGSSSTLEISRRMGRNLMNSVQEAHDRARGSSRRTPYPDTKASWYAMLWSMLVLGESSPAATLHRRRQCLPYLIEHYQAHFPEDLGLIENVVAPMFEGEREHHGLTHLISAARKGDSNARAPSPRSEATKHVQYKIGQHFSHIRYGYEGVIIGWDKGCRAEDQWIQQMRVDDLPRGRDQPFYNIVGEDRSIRYVAEENIKLVFEKPCDALMDLAGRYFMRWDSFNSCFVSNMRDEYPDD